MGSRFRLRPRWLALFILIAIILWMATGGPPITAQRQAPEVQVTETAPIKVRVQDSKASAIVQEVRIQGQVEALRHVQLKAQTSGQVVDLPVARGQRVKAGSLLVELSAEARPAQLSQAEAQVRQARHALLAARALQQQGLQAQSRLLELEAQQADAEASLESARLELSHTRIRTPFDGILDLRPVELGDFIDRGDPVATVVDVQTLLATAQVPQQWLAELKLGQPVQVQLLDGRILAGTLSYLAVQGNDETRSYRVEARVPNPDWLPLAGLSATLTLPVESVMAHFVSPALLSLDAQGQLAVKAVDDKQRVVVYPVQLVRASVDGVWVRGLPEQVRLISLGQGFVSAGEQVEAVPIGPGG